MPATEAPKTSETVYMKGGGYYSRVNLGMRQVINNSLDLVKAAIDGMDIGGRDRVFGIGDYGSADGGTSHELFRNIIAMVRARAPKRPIVVNYNDLPKNDFSALFGMLNEEDDVLGVRSYMRDYDNVYVLASGTSFYRQVFPSESIDFGYSCTALHWLSEKPGSISNHIHAVGAKGAELKAYASQARKDWQTILLHRAAELVPGGKLVFVIFSKDEQGRFLGNTGGVSMFDTSNAIWLKLVDEGVVTKEEYVNVTFPQFYRTTEDFLAPFSDPSSDVNKAGLSLDHIESRIVGCPYADRYRKTRDLDSFAPAYVDMYRSWSESTFYNGLSPSHPAEERNRIVDLFYSQYEKEVRRRPDEHSMAHVHHYMLISKAK